MKRDDESQGLKDVLGCGGQRGTGKPAIQFVQAMHKMHRRGLLFLIFFELGGDSDGLLLQGITSLFSKILTELFLNSKHVLV